MTACRDMRVEDLHRVLVLNQASVPAVGTLDMVGLRSLYELSQIRWLLEEEGDLAAFLFAMEPGTAYQSPNYRWLSERFERFVYVDRIAIAPAFQRRGLGSQIYQRLGEAARERGADLLLAEVNVEPPNPQSIAFHEASGWHVIDDLEHAPGKAVRFFEYTL